MKTLKRVKIESTAELRKWLSEHYASGASVWLVLWKKASGRPWVPYDDIVEQCLCFGWIDSLPRKLDERRTLLRISPRSKRSNWSRANRERVKKLIEDGLMHPAGMELVEYAQKSGTWDFLDDVEKAELPADLLKEFKKHPGARRLFEKFPRSSRRAILEWIKTAKTKATRERRITDTARKAAQNRKANFPKGRDAGPKPD